MISVIVVAVSLVFGGYLYEPIWFDTRTHYLYKTYESEESCLEAKEKKDKEITFPEAFQRGSVCVDDKSLSSISSSLFLTQDLP